MPKKKQEEVEETQEGQAASENAEVENTEAAAEISAQAETAPEEATAEASAQTAEAAAEVKKEKPKKSRKAKTDAEPSLIDNVIDTVAAAVGSVANTIAGVIGGAPEAEPVEKKGGSRAQRIGVVTSDKMTKTVTVRVDRLIKHPKYRRYVRRKKQFMAHDETGAAIGDKVRIMETRPLSARKRWRVVEIIQKAAK